MTQLETVCRPIRLKSSRADVCRDTFCAPKSVCHIGRKSPYLTRKQADGLIDDTYGGSTNIFSMLADVTRANSSGFAIPLRIVQPSHTLAPL
jgi:hypothetical protein